MTPRGKRGRLQTKLAGTARFRARARWAGSVLSDVLSFLWIAVAGGSLVLYPAFIHTTPRPPRHRRVGGSRWQFVSEYIGHRRVARLCGHPA